MISLSEFAVVGVIEMFLVVFIGVVMLLFYNQRLRAQIASGQKTILGLKQSAINLKSNAQKSHKKTNIPLLTKTLKKSQIQCGSVVPGKQMSLKLDCNKSGTAALRHFFLAGEMRAARCANEQAMWEKLESHYVPLIKQMASPSDSESQIDIFDRNRWADLTDAARRVLVDGSAEAQEQLGKIIESTSRDLGFDDVELPKFNPVLAAKAAAEKTPPSQKTRN
jgi:Sec-independent protein translocase protein TatA